ncbi:MAG TPA: phospholipase D-like domain-containing protein [Rhodopila sp.]|nr:phospholipase D-like domain-containing protein [Rhodopila sp.]
MLPVRVGIVSQSDSVKLVDVVRVVNALNVQASRDLAPIWGCSAMVSAIASPDAMEPGVWPVYIVDEMPNGMGGVHQTDHNQPYAMVLSGETWSLAASHECLEMLVDPSGNRLVPSNAVGIVDNEVCDVPGKFEYLLEVADPSEDESCAYLIDDVLVSDFYTPRYFDPTPAVGVRYSFTGRLQRPRQVLPNGYLSWFNAALGRMQQVRAFGAPVIVDLPPGRPGPGSITNGMSLRGFIDRHTKPPMTLSRLPRRGAAVRHRDSRAEALDEMVRARGGMFAAAATAALAAHASAAVDPNAVLARHLDAFRRPGVISVRPGRQIVAGQVTMHPAIVVTVRPDQAQVLAAALPHNLEGVPVDIRPAGVMKQMMADQPFRFVALGSVRHELREPVFPDEVFFDANGQPLPASPAADALAAGHPKKPHVDYTPAAGVTLDEVTENVTLILHISPDAGWAQLSDFLGGVQSELVVGMYDFTSAHILQAVETDLAGKQLTLTLDRPAKNPSADQTDEETRQSLEEKLRQGFQAAWALTNADRLAPVWIFPNAYHIKVAVREDGTFWLSSGNWNNSNQPEIDLSDTKAARAIAAKHDRDWHVIASGGSLGSVFRAFLQHDFEVAHNTEEGAAPVDATGFAVPPPHQQEVPPEVLAAGRLPRQFFQPKTISGRIRIQPLLTPDNYQPHVLKLVQSAAEKFYMQTQYIHPSGRQGDEGHDALITAVADLLKKGVDVRLICSEFENADWVEKVADAGIDPSVLRIQPKVHNKGIVVDGKVAMISSQNWSADGTLRNRDAGLIIWDERAAAYFEAIFLHDWDHLASASHG